jgi:site-specific DNA recombinase
LTYYTCQPQLDRVGNPQDYADHPRSVYVREDRLLDCVQTFFAQRVFGQDRAVLLRHRMAKQGTHERQDHNKRIAAIEKAIAELGRRQDNLMDEREAKTIDDNDEAKLAELDELRIGAEREQPQQPELLDMLPQLALDLADAPDPAAAGSVRSLRPEDLLRPRHPQRHDPRHPAR